MDRPIQKMIQPLTALIILLAAGWAMAAGTNTLTVTAAVLSKSNCKFNSATSTLNFGVINPSSVVNANASTTVNFVCNGSALNATFFIFQDYGLYKTGPGANRMRHATVLTEFLPYSLVLNPTSATVPKGVTQTLTISGTVTPASFQSALAGNFADTVIITLAP